MLCALAHGAFNGIPSGRTLPYSNQWQWNGAPQSSGTIILSFTNPPSAQPGHFDSLSFLAGGWLQLNMRGAPYSNYVLEITSDWTNWAPLTNLSGTNGFFKFTDPSRSSNAVRFYRLRSRP